MHQLHLEASRFEIDSALVGRTYDALLRQARANDKLSGSHTDMDYIKSIRGTDSFPELMNKFESVCPACGAGKRRASFNFVEFKKVQEALPDCCCGQDSQESSHDVTGGPCGVENWASLFVVRGVHASKIIDVR